MLGQPFPLCVSRALHPGQALKYGHPLAELCGSVISVTVEECSTECTVGQCAGIGGRSVACPLSLTRPAELKHGPLHFRARPADRILTVQISHIRLTTGTLRRRKELVG